jgi:hypothetical protein
VGASSRVSVGYLHPGEVDTHFHLSLLAMVLYDFGHNHRLGGHLAVEAGSGGIAASRNEIVRHFLSTRDEWLFMVDADMGFEPDTVDRLLEAAHKTERPIVGGLAFAQHALEGSKGPLGNPQYKTLPTVIRFTERGLQAVEDYPRGALVECDATGAACLLIHRSVFEKMVGKFPDPMSWFDHMTLDGRYYSEDVTFCMRAKSLGFPVYVDTSVKTSHRKHHYLTEDSVVPQPAVDPTAVLVPVMARPQNAEPFMRSLRASTGMAAVYAIANDDDHDTIEAWRAAGAEVITGPVSTFAEKINLGCAKTAEPWVFVVGDDVRFHPGWLDRAQMAAGDGYHVVGTNDLGNPRVMAGEHATHLLIRRSYIDEQGGSWDGPGTVCHEGYRHWYVDDELVTVAKQRGVWAMASGAVVEHLHPAWGKAPDDDVYRLGQSHQDRDRYLFQKRLKGAA